MSETVGGLVVGWLVVGGLVLIFLYVGWLFFFLDWWWFGGGGGVGFLKGVVFGLESKRRSKQ